MDPKELLNGEVVPKLTLKVRTRANKQINIRLRKIDCMIRKREARSTTHLMAVGFSVLGESGEVGKRGWACGMVKGETVGAGVAVVLNGTMVVAKGFGCTVAPKGDAVAPNGLGCAKEGELVINGEGLGLAFVVGVKVAKPKELPCAC